MLPPPGEFPGLAEARSHLVSLVQQPGEALFVPSGWFHTGEMPTCLRCCYHHFQLSVALPCWSGRSLSARHVRA